MSGVRIFRAGLADVIVVGLISFRHKFVSLGDVLLELLAGLLILLLDFTELRLKGFQVALLVGQLPLGVLDFLDTIGGGVGGDYAPEGVLDRLEPVVAVDAEEVSSGQQALNVLVVRVQDHEDWRNLLVQVPHHGQRHALVQVVPAEGNHV